MSQRRGHGQARERSLTRRGDCQIRREYTVGVPVPSRRLTAVATVAMTISAAVLGAQTVPIQRALRTLRSSVELTVVTVTVRDADGRLVPDLPADAFTIYEDGEPQTITQFTHDRVPVGLGLLLDVSDSMFGQRIRDACAAVERFLFELLSQDDALFVMTFNHNPNLLTSWITPGEAPTVRSALDTLRPSGGTAIYDTVIASLGVIDHRPRDRAALVLISDGADTASDASLREVHAALTRSDIFVYAIAIDSGDRQAINTRVNPASLQAITDDSGGRTEIVRSTADLDAAAARIAEELNSQYLLAYTSPRGADGLYHSLRVRVRGTDYKVRARNGYVAAPLPRP